MKSRPRRAHAVAAVVARAQHERQLRHQPTRQVGVTDGRDGRRRCPRRSHHTPNAAGASRQRALEQLMPNSHATWTSPRSASFQHCCGTKVPMAGVAPPPRGPCVERRRLPWWPDGWQSAVCRAAVLCLDASYHGGIPLSRRGALRDPDGWRSVCSSSPIRSMKPSMGEMAANHHRAPPVLAISGSQKDSLRELCR